MEAAYEVDVARRARDAPGPLPAWGAVTLNQSEIDFDGQNPNTAATSRADLLARFDKNVSETRSALTGKSDAEMMAPWSLKQNGQKLFTMPKTAVWRVVAEPPGPSPGAAECVSAAERRPGPGDVRTECGRSTEFLKIVPGLLAGLVGFILLATANGAGYRYGVSDQAAYVPAVVRAENPAAFPRDAIVIDTQGQFFVLDEVLAAIGRMTGASTETLFFGAYLASVTLIWAGVLLIGTRLYTSPWLTVALAAVITLRHSIPRTSANSLEPYFHPRLMAFGFGMLAIGALLRRRDWLAVTLVGLSAVCHVTTALWFAILIGTALAILDRHWRRAAGGAGIAVVVLTWAIRAGPLHAPTAMLDPVWLEALAERNFIFANEWPLWAWTANLGLLAVLWLAHITRERRGTAWPVDHALIWGATALVAIFLLTLPAVAAHVAVAVQFQLSRVFWVVDLLVAIYGLAALGESLRGRGVAVLAIVLLAASIARGTYIIQREHAERSLFQLSLPDTPWTDAMRWIARQPLDAHVLADPGHSWKYGSSVRVAAERDVLLEDVKDSAIAMYNRDLAVRVVERRRALVDFPALNADGARALAARYDLNFLVTEATLNLPEVYRNAQFRIYALKPAGPASDP
jgi:hypothetical protein